MIESELLSPWIFLVKVILKMVQESYFLLILFWKLFLGLTLDLLADSANTNCHPFPVKMNFSQFIIDGLQQQCHMTLLVSFSFFSFFFFFFCNIEKLNFLMYLCEESKSSGMFQQNILKIPVKKLHLQHNLLHMNFKVPSKIFLTWLQLVFGLIYLHSCYLMVLCSRCRQN